jgi:hypothetical protein
MWRLEINIENIRLKILDSGVIYVVDLGILKIDVGRRNPKLKDLLLITYKC